MKNMKNALIFKLTKDHLSTLQEKYKVPQEIITKLDKPDLVDRIFDSWGEFIEVVGKMIDNDREFHQYAQDIGKVAGIDLAEPYEIQAEVTRPVQAEVALKPAYRKETSDESFWVAIRGSTNAISFTNYDDFITPIMCGIQRSYRSVQRGPFPRVRDYNLLKAGTEEFLKDNCGVVGFELEAKTDIIAALEAQGVSLEHIKKFTDYWENYLQHVEQRDLTLRDANDKAKLSEFQKNPNQTLLENIPINIEKKLIQTLPYLALIRDHRLREVPIGAIDQNQLLEKMTDCYYRILEEKFTNPCFLELIWSYWHEESMLAQTMKAISLRFQNRRRSAGVDPLAHLNIDPLRPLNNLLWGYIQDEQHRLNLQRRVYEYNHEYGLTLYGKAVPKLQAVDSRSKFIEAFHNLLHQCTIFFVSEDDTTVIADGFPVLNALKEVHLLLTQGQHNQYGDLPWNARMEMLMEQWILSRPEFREFLSGRTMIAYPEAWMDRVDVMKSLQGWIDVSIINFNVLATSGEQILLSIRFGNWLETQDSDRAANWAKFWRNEIQAYIHNYRVVTGVDLTLEPVDTALPSIYLRRRLAEQLKELPTGRQVRRLVAAKRARTVPKISAPVQAELIE